MMLVKKEYKKCSRYARNIWHIFKNQFFEVKWLLRSLLNCVLNKVINKDEDFVCIIKLMNDNVFGEEILGNGEKDTGETLII